jgi:hypothetical protein
MSVLQALCFAYNPQQAAASSGLLINSRKSSEFELLYKVDKNFSGQVYVILKVPHPSQAHMDIGPSVNSCSEQVLYSVPFPPMVEGKSQLLMDDSDQRFLSIFDANFEIYLS